MSGARLLTALEGQRWFARRSEEPVDVHAVDRSELVSGAPRIVDLLAEVDYSTGDRDFYQLLLSDPDSRDALGDPECVGKLVELIRSGASSAGRDGRFEFAPVDGELPAGAGSLRVLGVEQTNTSVVVDERVLVKVYRRLEAGVSPELELLRFLAAHGFANAPELLGSWSYSGNQMTATLGIVQRFLPAAIDGWELGLREVSERPDSFAERMPRLGEVIGKMHATLAGSVDDPSFAPEQATRETFSLLAATVDDEIEQLALHLPADEPVAQLAGSADAARELMRSLGTVASLGKLIRHHGDLHLGQVLWTEDDWFVVDFEGEPARPLAERRTKRSPLRDVAGVLRSFDYLVRVGGGGDELERRLRDEFVTAYLGAVHGAGILPPHEDVERLIAIFELEKAVYELRYELAHRPDWVWIPVAGLQGLLERAFA